MPVYAVGDTFLPLEEADAVPPVTREDLAHTPGAFLLHGCLTPGECEHIIQTAEKIGFIEDSATGGRSVRQMESCQTLMSEETLGAVFRRFAEKLPPGLRGERPLGLNARWRVYKYNPGDTFRKHTDGGWPGGGVDAATGVYKSDVHGDRWSQVTWVMYLNEGFEGGATRFFRRVGDEDFEVAGDVEPKRGSAMCFFHGKHPLSPLHEGSPVVAGTKYIIRSDVLYELPAEEAPAGASAGAKARAKAGASRSFYDLDPGASVAGQEVAFDRMRGRVVYAINVASKCGRTAFAYAKMRELADKKGLDLLLFPSAQFGDQEFAENAEIEAFVEEQGLAGRPNVHVLERTEVLGGTAHPAWQLLREATGAPDPDWNFAGQFLVGKTGEVQRIPKGRAVGDVIDELLDQDTA